MALINLENISIAFGADPVLDNISLQIQRGDRIALLGRNGCGKSTLMKIINGVLEPDSGNISREKGVSAAVLPQDIPANIPGTVFDVASSVFDKSHLEEWEYSPDVEKAISFVSLNKDDIYNNLSAGNKRRTLLAGALAQQPDILLLDEPTNHLDIESVAWMEDFFSKYKGTLLFVTHDRFFLRRIANKIAEIDLGILSLWSTSYEKFLIHKDEQLNAEQKERERFDKKLDQEEAWIRRGIKARRTRNEGRVRALQKMRRELSERRDRQGNVNMSITEADKSGKVVINAKDIEYAWGDLKVIKTFSTKIMRGDRIGVIGGNGTGKSTLLQLLTGKLSPDAGSIQQGTNLHTVYFDQLREQLDENKTVRENVLPIGDAVDINGQKKHIVGYLKDFLFDPDTINSPVKMLSGGERNRLLLARLFTRPANLLILDEPTNDLDMETLDLLEELLFDFSGTVILVSHDRAFLNNVVTSTIAFEGNGQVKEYVGGYDDWLEQRKTPEKGNKKTADKKATERSKPKEKKKRLGFNETRELAELPAKIEQMELRQEELHALLADPESYKDAQNITNLKKENDTLEETLLNAYNRWEELEALK